MLNELVSGKVYYKIFDRKFTESTGKYQLFRCETDADVKQAIANRWAVLRASRASALCLLRQEHSNKVVAIKSTSQSRQEPIADGIVTNKTGIAIGIYTADCAPILLYCPEGKAIAALHAGWRGALGEIIESTIAKLQEAGAADICAYLGPTIKQSSYEVDSNFRQKFIQQNPSFDSFFQPGAAHRPGHYYFDLPAFAKNKLLQNGIDQITDIEHDTYTMPELYPSYRRSCHQGEQYRQNILSVIMLRP